MKTINKIDIKNKAVIIRVDFNVPIKDGVITSNKRIVEAIPTIKYALDNGAKVILLSHLGRIKTEEDKAKKTLSPVAKELESLIGLPVKFCPETKGAAVEAAVKELEFGQILMLENTRFEDLDNKSESKNNPELGKYWASLADVFINDAFGTCHRAHASNVGITNNIAEAGFGFLVEKELMMLGKVVESPNHPAVAIIGGAKVSDKIKVIDKLAAIYDKVIIGGGMTFTFFKAMGEEIGNSLCEDEQIETAKTLLEKFGSKIVLPIDSAISPSFSDVKPAYTDGLSIPSGFMGLDIGPKSIELFVKTLQGAKTVVWNGPLGVTEFENYKIGTETIAKTIASLDGVYSVVGGGDSVAAIKNLNLEDKLTHISTGGGASLCLLEGSDLPAVTAILNK
ncbi:MAG: phosphoglycerate kinase [Mycoplasma sp.]